jgi:hypothetical protein
VKLKYISLVSDNKSQSSKTYHKNQYRQQKQHNVTRRAKPNADNPPINPQNKPMKENIFISLVFDKIRPIYAVTIIKGCENSRILKVQNVYHIRLLEFSVLYSPLLLFSTKIENQMY